MKPPHVNTLEKLIRELDEAIDRNRQFIVESDDLRDKWQFVAQTMDERLRARSSSRTRAGDVDCRAVEH